MNQHYLKQGKAQKQILIKQEPLTTPLTYPAKAVQAIKKYNGYLLDGYSLQEARLKTAGAMTLTREEVNELLVNSEYFNDATLQFLAVADVNYKQYQAQMQRVIQKAVEELRQDGLLDGAIKFWVGKLIQHITLEFDYQKKITLKHWNIHWASYIGYKNNTLQEPPKKRKRIKKQSFSYATTFSNPGIKLPENIADIQWQLDQTVSILASLPVISSDSMGLIKKKLKKEIIELAKTVLGIGDLQNNDNQEVVNGQFS